jgi:hypothetical protein
MSRAPTSLSALLAAAGVLLAPACGGGDGPTYTLRVVMLEIEGAKKDVEQALLTPTDSIRAIEDGALAIQRWMDDPAIERYLEKDDLLGTSGDFRRHQAELEEVLDGILAATAAGDERSARRAYPSLVAACNRCHAIFRPDL